MEIHRQSGLLEDEDAAGIMYLLALRLLRGTASYGKGLGQGVLPEVCAVPWERRKCETMLEGGVSAMVVDPNL